MSSKALFATAMLALLALAAASAAGRNHVWSDTGRTPPATRLHKVYVSVKQSNVDLLPSLVEDVSSPTSPKYGAYLTQAQLTELIAPTEEAFDTVYEFLSRAGAVSLDTVAHRDVIVASFDYAHLEAAFGVSMSYFAHPTGIKLARTVQDITLPKRVAKHIDLVQGINDFPMPKRRSARSIMYPTGEDVAMTAGPAGSPVFSFVGSPGHESIRATFGVTCMDGSMSFASPPCADHPPQLTSISMTATSMYNAPAATFTTSTSAADACTTAKTGVTCNTMSDAVYYDNFNVSITLNFGAKSGPMTYWQFPVVSVPSVTPQTLAALYNIPSDTAANNGTQSVGEFEQQYYDVADLDNFFASMGIRGKDTPVTVVGPNIQSDDGGEANLDIQYIMGVARGVPTTFWSIKANSSIEIDDILKWGYQVSNTSDPPLVNSLSYGMTAHHVDQYLGQGYLHRSDVEFMKMALRGITIIIADGDTGAGDLGPPPMSNDHCATLHPDWPSQSPYVLAIASTYITPNAQPICYMDASVGGMDCSKQPLGEVSVSLDSGLFWTSGGGFANTASQPSYQAAAVAGYLAQPGFLPPSNYFNATGRAYPDAVAVGHNLVISWNGKLMPIDGTSASAPIFAGVMSLINSARLDAQQPPIGFANPLLYHAAATNPATFNDITVGDNRCGAQGFAPLCCDYGYKAAIGWDAATGLGSPDYGQLLAEALRYGEMAKQNLA